MPRELAPMFVIVRELATIRVIPRELATEESLQVSKRFLASARNDG
jgi:hypothetical protein